MTRIIASDLPPLPQETSIGDVIAIKFLPLALAASAFGVGCTSKTDSTDTYSYGTETNTETGADTQSGTPTTGETGTPTQAVGFACNGETIEVDFDDVNRNGVYDVGDLVQTVYLPGGCSLEVAKSYLDDYGTGSGNIVLVGGDSDVYLGGLNVAVGQNIDISVDSSVSTATIIGLDTTSPIISNSGSLALFGNGKMKFSGFATNTAIESSGTGLHVTGVDFDNLATGFDVEGGTLTATDVVMTQIQDIGIHIYNGADATLLQIVMNNGLIGSETQNAILASEAGHLDFQQVAVVSQQTTGSVVDIDAAYFQIIGLELLNNSSMAAIVKLSAGTEFEQPSAQWSYFASSTIANNVYGPQGVLAIESEGDLVVHNIDVLYNESGGTGMVVDLSDAGNPYTGITTFTQSNVVGNTGLTEDGMPIKPSYVIQADIDAGYVSVDALGNPEIPVGDPTGFESIAYNNVADNGEAVDEDLGGTHLQEPLWAGESPSANTQMYNPEAGSLFYPDAYDVTNPALLNAGNPDAQYPDHSGYVYPAGYTVPAGNNGGSLSAHGGPVGHIHSDALLMLENEL